MRTVTITNQWYTAECDPEGKVKYQLKPITNTLAGDITGNIPHKQQKGRKGKVEFDMGYLTRMLVQVGLVGIEGLKDNRTANPDDPENEDLMKDLLIEFEEQKIGLKKRKVVKREILNLLPNALYAEIVDQLKGDIDVDDEENEEDGELNFTVDYSTPNGSDVEVVNVTTEPISTSAPITSLSEKE